MCCLQFHNRRLSCVGIGGREGVPKGGAGVIEKTSHVHSGPRSLSHSRETSGDARAGAVGGLPWSGRLPQGGG